MAHPDAILFTAFEPSGDALAAAVIRALLRRNPDLPIVAWGGPRMRAAGARIIEETGHDAAMGLPGLAKIREHLALNRRIADWVRAQPPALHVPVDSPAANFPVCKITRAAGARVVHLAAPQLWAWASHRIRKLRRRTDLVLCLLPFEEPWFSSRGVPARFVGHPIFDAPLDPHALDAAAADFPAGGPRIALLPGSRPAEWRRNFPVMLHALARARERWPDAAAVVAASSDDAEHALRRIAEDLGGWPDRCALRRHAVDTASRWCDAALTVSGTATLQVARAGAPMVILYRIPAFHYWAVGRWIIRAQHATLPNLVAGRRIVPEFVPFADAGEPAVDALLHLLADESARDQQRRDLARVADAFAGRHAADEAADAILRQLPR